MPKPIVPSPIRVEGDIAFVTLTHGFEATIDVADIDLVSGRKWAVQMGRHGHAYAYCNGSERLAMHRLLLSAAPGQYVDHVDGDGLNNRRRNIRLATATQNLANKVVERRNRLGIKGVHMKRTRYRATIKPNGKTIFLGSFATPEEAAAAYKGAARALWGEFAKD